MTSYHRRLLSSIVLIPIILCQTPRAGLLNPLEARTLEGCLVLNEISPWSSEVEVWIELLNPGNASVPLAGYTIEFLSGFSMTFNGDSGDVGPNEVYLHRIVSGSQLHPNGDGCILSDVDGPVDAITWGNPSHLDIPFSTGVPLNPLNDIFIDEEDIYEPDDVLIRIPGTWSPDLIDWVGSDKWTYRDSGSASPGQTNPYPAPFRVSPSDGARLASDVTLYVTGVESAQEIRFQVATDATFQDVVIEETVSGFSFELEGLSPGTYYWRTKSDNHPWSSHQEFAREDYDIDTLISSSGAGDQNSAGPGGLIIFKGQTLIDFRVLKVNHLSQNKDTAMVCLDGCNMNGNCSWCTDHSQPSGSDTVRRVCEHGSGYCSRACLAMVAASGGRSLSQDRISYYLFEEAGTLSRNAKEAGQIGNPLWDMGHKFSTFGSSIILALKWIYGDTSEEIKYGIYDSETFDDSDPSDKDSIKEFIRDNRPVIRNSRTHTTLITGYATMRDEKNVVIHLLKINDPWVAHGATWIELESSVKKYKHYIFPPASGTPVRNDEPDIHRDSDQDELCDFDEIYRFGTDPHNPDTDNDGIEDRKDILGYVFNPDGTWHQRNRDIDNDGLPKELDSDNDRPNEDGVPDGCEDINHNGFYEAGLESDNFVLGDDFSVISPDCFAGYIEVSMVSTGAAQKLVGFERIVLQQLSSSDAFDHLFYYDYNPPADAGHVGLGGTIANMPGSSGGTPGSARVWWEEYGDGMYWIRTQTRPATTEMTTTLTFDGFPELDTTWTFEAPLYFANGYFGPVKLEDMEKGGQVFRGTMDFASLEAGGNPLGPSTGSFIKYEIWVQLPDMN
jgi:hypothetical protein